MLEPLSFVFFSCFFQPTVLIQHLQQQPQRSPRHNENTASTVAPSINGSITSPQLNGEYSNRPPPPPPAVPPPMYPKYLPHQNRIMRSNGLVPSGDEMSTELWEKNQYYLIINYFDLFLFLWINFLTILFSISIEYNLLNEYLFLELVVFLLKRSLWIRHFFIGILPCNYFHSMAIYSVCIL